MKNKVFSKKTAEQKRRYLGAALKYITEGALDDGMIGQILPKVAIHEQYTVTMFPGYRAFQKAVAHAQTGKVRTSAVFSRSNGGMAAVVITPLKLAGETNSRRAIYIHAPLQQAGKGRKNGQNTQRTYSI